MATNFIQPGEVIDYTAAAALASGAGVKIGARVGVALGVAVARDVGARFEYVDLVAGLRQLVCDNRPGKSGSDDCDVFFHVYTWLIKCSCRSRRVLYVPV